MIMASEVSFLVSCAESFSVSSGKRTLDRTPESTRDRTRVARISRLAFYLALPHPGATGTAAPAVREPDLYW